MPQKLQRDTAFVCPKNLKPSFFLDAPETPATSGGIPFSAFEALSPSCTKTAYRQFAFLSAVLQGVAEGNAIVYPNYPTHRGYPSGEYCTLSPPRICPLEIEIALLSAFYCSWYTLPGIRSRSNESWEIAIIPLVQLPDFICAFCLGLWRRPKPGIQGVSLARNKFTRR